MVLADLCLVCSPILKNAFVVPPVSVPRRQTFTMVRTTYDYCPPHGGDWAPPYGPVYPFYHAFLANLGVVEQRGHALERGRLRRGRRGCHNTAAA